MKTSSIIHALPSFHRDLLSWFADHQRPLPWRSEYLPYHVWIAEMMGQQTQMERVVVYFQHWIGRFPDVASVAAAQEQEILKAWEGLGYYSRARYAHAAAATMSREYGGMVPNNHDHLISLPGIGPYTAAAIMSIAYNAPYPLLDANVERVFSRLSDIDRPLKERHTRLSLVQLAHDLLPQDNARNFNQALMELGALVCRPKEPDCVSCPVQSYCLAYAAGTTGLRPVRGKKQKKIDITMACVLIEHGDRLFIQQRMPDDVWGSLWEFPGGRLKEGESPAEAARREVMEETGFQLTDLHPFATVVHYYTRYRVTLHGFSATLREAKKPDLQAASQYRWVTVSELAVFPFPAGHRQLIARLHGKNPENWSK